MFESLGKGGVDKSILTVNVWKIGKVSGGIIMKMVFGGSKTIGVTDRSETTRKTHMMESQ